MVSYRFLLRVLACRGLVGVMLGFMVLVLSVRSYNRWSPLICWCVSLLFSNESVRLTIYHSVCLWCKSVGSQVDSADVLFLWQVGDFMLRLSMLRRYLCFQCDGLFGFTESIPSFLGWCSCRWFGFFILFCLSMPFFQRCSGFCLGLQRSNRQRWRGLGWLGTISVGCFVCFLRSVCYVMLEKVVSVRDFVSAGCFVRLSHSFAL